MSHHKLKTVQKHFFQRRTWSRIIFEKNHLFAPTGWTLLTHLGTRLFGACSLPRPSGPRYWGLGVRLGNSEGWKPQKVGGCGWSRCPRNRILSHVAKDMAYSWFVAVGIWSFRGPFWAFSGTYHGVRGPQRAR